MAALGTERASAADLVGWASESSTVVSEGVEYAVLDIYAEFDPTNVVVLNVYNAAISNAGGTAFHHSDLNTLSGVAGSWSPGLSGDFAGLDSSIDSFVLVGGVPGSSNTTSLDPNFDPSNAAVPPADAGWFNSNPPNEQGLADPTTGRVWVGRFATIASVAGDTLEFTATTTFAETPGGTAQQVTRSAAFAYPAIECDTLAATAASTSVPAVGTSSPVAIAIDVADDACAWTASSDTAWLTLSETSGSGDASISFSAPATEGAERSGTITLSSGTAVDVSIVVTQASGETGGCTIAVLDDTTQVSFIGSLYGDAFGFEVSADDTVCAWTATSSTPWITVQSGSSGTGSGSVTFTVDPNFFLPTRSGAVEIVQGGEVVAVHTVVQGQAAAECSGVVEFATSIVEADAEASTRTVAVSTNGVGCAWYASSNDSWITVEDGGSFTGDGVVTFSVSANTGGSPRSGSISIGSGEAQRILSIEQSGPCGFGISPSQQGVSYLGSLYGDFFEFSIDTDAACDWSVSVNAGSPPWIAIDGATSGSGAASISFSAEINLFQTQRTGTISVISSGIVVATHTVVQAGPAIECTEPVSLDPGMPTMDASGGTVEIAVSTNGVTCAWYAESNEEWIVISSGGSFTGDGTMVLNVAEHAGSETRSGTVTIGSGAAATTLEVVQAGTGGGGTCDLLAATAESTDIDASGTEEPIAVSVVVGGDDCAWSVVADADWISVAPDSGTGSGSFTYSASATDSAELRTATIVVASGTATPVSIEVTQAGDPCLADADGDGTGDCEDGCPDDPNKTEPGICGCGIDDANASEWYPDADGDGFGDANASPTTACSQPSGYVADNTDCDDTSATTYPGAEEVCDDLVDNDCDGQIDEECEPECDSIAVGDSQLDVPASGTVAPVPVSISVPADSCVWSATSDASWISILEGSGSGSGDLRVEVSENLSTEARSGTIEVSGGSAAPVTIGVDQSGYQFCDTPVDTDPPASSVSSAAGTTSVAISTPSGTCAWTAEVLSPAEWLVIDDSGTGIGEGEIRLSFTANETGEERSAVVEFTGGATHLVVQAAAAGCGPWSPSSLGDLAAWWKADGIDGVANGDLVTIWPDASGRGVDLFAEGTGPTLVVEGETPVVRFGSDEGQTMFREDTSVLRDAEGMLIYTVFKPFAIQNNPYLVHLSQGGSTASIRAGLMLRNSGTYWPRVGPLDSQGTNNATSMVGSIGVGQFVMTGMSMIDGQLSFWEDGGNLLAGASLSSDRFSNTNERAIHLGNDNHGSTFSGDIGEIVIVAAEVAEPDRLRVEGYLAHKWGLEWRLPDDHLYRNSPPSEEDCGGSLVVTPESTVVPAPGTVVPIDVEVARPDGGASGEWNASTSASWLAVVDSVQGDAFSGFGLAAAPNPGLLPRTALVTVETEAGENASFEIRQSAPCEHAGGPDCDGDGVSDLCAVLWGHSSDADGDGVPDDCGPGCPEDLNGDFVVDGADLTLLLAAWGEQMSGAADLDASGVVDGADLAALLAAWGVVCPGP